MRRGQWIANIHELRQSEWIILMYQDTEYQDTAVTRCLVQHSPVHRSPVVDYYTDEISTDGQ